MSWIVTAQFSGDERIRWTVAGFAVLVQLMEVARLLPDPRVLSRFVTVLVWVGSAGLWAAIGWGVVQLFDDLVSGAAATLVVAGVIGYGLFGQKLARTVLRAVLFAVLTLWMAVMRYGLARLVFWALVGWLLADPLRAQVQATHPAVLVSLGLLLGLFGNLAAGAGVGAVLAFASAGPALLWWLIPLVAGASVGPIRANRLAWRVWWRYPAYLAGRPDGPPGVEVRVVDTAAVLAGLVPVVAVVATGRPGGFGSFVAATALAGLHWYVYAESGRLTRQARQEVRFASALWVVYLASLSSGPAGDWFIRTWQNHPFLYEHAAVAALVGAFLLHFLQVAYTSTLARALTTFSTPHLRLALAASYGLFPGPALALFLAAGVYHVDNRLLTAAQWLIGAAAVVSLFLIRRTGRAQQKLDASIFVHASPMVHLGIASAWRHDAIVARRDYPDFTLPRTLIREGIGHALGDRSAPPVRLIGAWLRAGPGRQVRLDEWLIAWIDDAAQLLSSAEEDARARLSGAPLDKFRRKHALIRGYCAKTLGEVYQLLGFREEAAASFLDAARIWEGQNHNSLAALCRLDAAVVDHLRPDRALAALAPVPDDPSTLPLLRRRARMLTGAFQLRLGDIAAAERSFAEGVAISVQQRDFNRMSKLEGEIEGRGVVISALAIPRVDVWLISALARVCPAALTMVGVDDTNDRTAASMIGLDLELSPAAQTPAGDRIADVARYWQTRQYPRVVRNVVKAASILESLGLIQTAFSLCGTFGLALRRIDPRAACVFLGIALDWYEELRARINNDDLRIALFEQAEEMYEVAARLVTVDARDTEHLELDQPAEVIAFDWIERARSRVLAELMGDRVPAPRAPAPQKLIKEERASVRRFARAREQIRTVGARREAVVALRTAQAELTDCWTKMLAHDSLTEYAALRAGIPAGYDSVRELLGHGESRTVLAEYLVTEESTLLFVGRADLDCPVVLDVPLGRGRLRELCMDLFTGPAATRRLQHVPPSTWQDSLRPLVVPLMDWCAPGDTVWFVPHDVLHHVPMHAVWMNDRTCVADRHPVRYTPSASTSHHTVRKRDHGRELALIFADGRPDRPLIHARQEGLAIADLFGDQAHLYVGEAATTAQLTRQLAQSGRGVDVVHLACHGEFDPDQSMRSGLLMAPDGTGDGRLTAANILNLRLPTNLVTLSACETGRNTRRPGDELIGLTRALLYAGASAVVTCLWSVDELSTSLMMRGFYQARLAGLEEAAALQKAQLDLRCITAADVVEYCAEIRSKQTTVGPTLDLNIAEARFWARDYQSAADTFAAVVRNQPAGSAMWARAQSGAAQARRAATHTIGTDVDYARAMFDHPYYWAPFLVIGGGQ